MMVDKELIGKTVEWRPVTSWDAQSRPPLKGTVVSVSKNGEQVRFEFFNEMRGKKDTKLASLKYIRILD